MRDHAKDVCSLTAAADSLLLQGAISDSLGVAGKGRVGAKLHTQGKTLTGHVLAKT
jgi:hypothetical protein